METVGPQPWTGLTPPPSPSTHGSRYTGTAAGDRSEAVVIRPPPDASVRTTHSHPSAGSISSHPLHTRDPLQTDADSVTDRLHPSLRARPLYFVRTRTRFHVEPTKWCHGATVVPRDPVVTVPRYQTAQQWIHRRPCERGC